MQLKFLQSLSTLNDTSACPWPLHSFFNTALQNVVTAGHMYWLGKKKQPSSFLQEVVKSSIICQCCWCIDGMQYVVMFCNQVRCYIRNSSGFSVWVLSWPLSCLWSQWGKACTHTQTPLIHTQLQYMHTQNVSIGMVSLLSLFFLFLCSHLRPFPTLVLFCRKICIFCDLKVSAISLKVFRHIVLLKLVSVLSKHNSTKNVFRYFATVGWIYALFI